MKQHIHYPTNYSREDKERILRKAYDLRTNWWIDELDCLKSFHRQLVPDVSFDDAMGHFGNGALFSIVFRRGQGREEPYCEISFRSMTSPDYFVWIILVSKDSIAEFFFELLKSKPIDK